MELSTELTQAQRLSPQMIQSMEILQMGALELQEYIEQVLLENPVLEREESREQETGAQLLRQIEWMSAGDRQNSWYYREDARDYMTSVADPRGESLYSYLRSQLDLERLSPNLRRAAQCVLSGLNENGYLEETSEELAERCAQPLDMVLAAENLVRGLDPAGVGSRTLSECLALQLERQRETGPALTIVRSHLEDLARGRYQHIAQLTGASREEVRQACQLIRTLDPRPGAAFSSAEPSRYLVPDLLVEEVDGRLVVSANDSTIPELKISPYYQQLLRETGEEQVREYLTDRLQQAVRVVKAVEQRGSTLLSCARCIVDYQEAFFRQGTLHLRPLTLAVVAGQLKIHASTVSRAVKDKYLQCARGLYPLSWFFSRALSAGQGEELSREQAKAALAALIAGEDRSRPLSDQKLCELLEKQGLTLSRRTVAKYRDELGLGAAAARRES